MRFFYISLLIFLNMAGGVIIKVFADFSQHTVNLLFLLPILGTIFFLQTVLWLLLGKHYQLSYVYPFLSVGYVLSLAVGYMFFHESVSFLRGIGATIIMTGAFIVSTSPHVLDAHTQNGTGEASND
ncbi:hypothetical protein FACS1894170_13550 [Planctomycetales bacterium]|nr:hypothetical protein FACS1894170_13550 [Planctomycetales bacterium]